MASSSPSPLMVRSSSTDWRTSSGRTQESPGGHLCLSVLLHLIPKNICFLLIFPNKGAERSSQYLCFYLFHYYYYLRWKSSCLVQYLTGYCHRLCISRSAFFFYTRVDVVVFCCCRKTDAFLIFLHHLDSVTMT